jgi:hypothetical protein
MKCCESPTTSTAANLPVQIDERKRIEASMQAVVFAEILKPLSASLGPFGDLATGSIAQSLFVRPNQ